MPNSFCDRRALSRLTQEEAAEHLGVKQSTVSMWETGGSLPRAELLPKIAALYGCTVDELLRDGGGKVTDGRMCSGMAEAREKVMAEIERCQRAWLVEAEKWRATP